MVSSGQRGERGFTILEMMVVLAIVGMAMMVAPGIIAGLEGSRLRAAADELVWRLRETRNEAIRSDAATELVLNPADRTYAIGAGASPHPLPAVVDAVEVTPSALRRTDGTIRIRFLPDGTATPARITLRHGSSAGIIAINWLTGGVGLDG
jgi:general secretion pathway protein H